MSRIYVASSWRNTLQPHIVRALRDAGYEVYDFRNPALDEHGFSWSEVSLDWLEWTPDEFIRDLYSGHPSVERGFGFDKTALDWADTCVLVLPCGRSAHLEAGYSIGQGKRTLFFLHPDKFEPELMYLLGHGCCSDFPGLLTLLDSDPQRATTSAAAETVPCEVSVLQALLKDFEGDDPHHPTGDKIRAILQRAATPGPRKKDETV